MNTHQQRPWTAIFPAGSGLCPPIDKKAVEGESRMLALRARHAKHGMRSGINASGFYAGPGRAKKTAIV